MKLLFSLFLAVILFSSCGKTEKSNESRNESETQDKTGTTNTNQGNSSNSTEASGDDGLKNLSYEVGTLPQSVKYDGKVVAGAKWDDNNGQNILIITETAEKNQSNDERMKELFAYLYVVNGSDTKLLWRVNDFIKDCPLDITMNYLQKSLIVTDLNNNGIAENTFLYIMSCRGDVSPEDMKLIMHEGETKYAIRGSRKLEMSGESYGGETKVDPSFDNAPVDFLPFAKEQWAKFRTVKIDY